jgi:hypothetical protein
MTGSHIAATGISIQKPGFIQTDLKKPAIGELASPESDTVGG